jgi:hypothetical protein
MSKEQSSDEQASTTLNNAILAAMITSKQRHKLLMADRTGDAAWITAAIEHLVAADPTVTLDEIEGVLRDAAGSAYVIGTADRFEVVIGMPAWLAALAEARVTAAENRAALGDTHPAVLPK